MANDICYAGEWRLTPILEWVRDQALTLGCQYRQQIEEAADVALTRVFHVVDIPYIPEPLESMIEKRLKRSAMLLVDSILDQLCGPDADVQPEPEA